MSIHNDPKIPEFPPDEPKFPATPIISLNLEGYEFIQIKDESVNRWSGTHKDRLAWEIVVSYKNLKMGFKNIRDNGNLPQFSLITSGSAGLAISRMLKEYNLPKLKILIDFKLCNKQKKLYDTLVESYCELYEADLSAKQLNSEEILTMTNNSNGFDLTAFQGITRDFVTYDWLCYEILNIHPDYIFVPYGSGTLFREILCTIRELQSINIEIDTRYYGTNYDRQKLRTCCVLGATSTNPDTQADKLYAPFRPFVSINKNLIEYYKRCNFCGNSSGIYFLQEEYLKQAYQIALKNNINCEPSGIAGLGLLFQLGSQIPSNKRIVIVNTGKLKI